MFHYIYDRLATYTVLGHNQRLITLALRIQILLVKLRLVKWEA